MLDAWLRGPIDGVPPLLMPAAHALVQTMDDVERAAASLTPEELWHRPGGVASVGFNLRHIAGVTDRLLTYAREESLTEGQLASLAAEAEPGTPPASARTLLDEVRRTLDAAVEQFRSTAPDTLLQVRHVGRQRLESNVLGLLYHAADHAQRHAGQVVATAGVMVGGRGTPADRDHGHPEGGT
jgi:uncharacterized damage-inducible protein DinB